MFSTNLERLRNSELGWESLESRRRRHKLFFLHRAIYGNFPQYLTELLPPFAGGVERQVRYQLTLRPFRCKTCSFQNSFFPSATSLWNNLTEFERAQHSIMSFKLLVNNKYLPARPPAYYGQGQRSLSILHTQLRMKHNSLNHHLHRIGVCDNPLCQCGQGVESEAHFLLHCPLYTLQRARMFEQLKPTFQMELNIFNIERMSSATLLNILLCGSERLSQTANLHVFEHVHSFIRSSIRFSIFQK